MKLKNITIVCESPDVAKACWYKNQFTSKYIINNNKEFDLTSIPYFTIANTILLKASQGTSSMDILNTLKVYNIDAIVLENTTSLQNGEVLCLDTVDDLVDYVIAADNKFTFTQETAKELKKHAKWEKLYSVTHDENILPDTVKDIFIF